MFDIHSHYGQNQILICVIYSANYDPFEIIWDVQTMMAHFIVAYVWDIELIMANITLCYVCDKEPIIAHFSLRHVWHSEAGPTSTYGILQMPVK